MSILIKGMEMPTEGYIDVRIKCNGTASFAIANNPYFKAVEAVPVPPHGRLIDANEISKHKYATIPPYRKEYSDGKPKSEDEVIAFKFGWNDAIDAIVANAPTIIEAEEGE